MNRTRFRIHLRRELEELLSPHLLREVLAVLKDLDFIEDFELTELHVRIWEARGHRLDLALVKEELNITPESKLTPSERRPSSLKKGIRRQIP